jgi:hypothetical protein
MPQPATRQNRVVLAGLALIEESQDGSSVGGFVSSLAHADDLENLFILIDSINSSMASI